MQRVYISLWLWESKISVYTRESAWHMMKYIYMHIIASTWWPHQMETFSTLLAFCAGNHRSPVNSPHKGQWRRVLMFSLICAWTNSWANNGDTSDLRCHRAHYDVTVMHLINKSFMWITRDRLNLARNWFVWIMSLVSEIWMTVISTISLPV